MKGRIALPALMVFSVFMVLLTASETVSAQLNRDTDHSADQSLKSNARVNPSTLAMELSIPIGGYAGRAGTGLPVTFNYSSKVWEIRYLNSWDSGSGTKSDTRPNYAMRTAAGWTSSLGTPRIEYDFDMYSPFVDGATSYDGAIFTPDMGLGQSGPNFSLYYVKRVRVIMPDGSSHEFRKDDGLHGYGTSHSPGGAGLPEEAGVYLSTDGSKMKLDLSSSSSTLFLPDGSRYLFGTRTTEHKAHTFVDRHGNKMTYDIANRRWTDTMGRVLQDVMPQNWAPFVQSQAVGDVVASFPGLGTGTVNATFSWRYLKDPGQGESGLENASDLLHNLSNVGCQGSVSHTLEGPYLFSNPEATLARVCHPITFDESSWTAGPPFNPVVLTKIQLANGQSYQFKYNVYGEITKIIYPAGGYEKFTYGPIDPVQPSEATYDQGNRGVVTRRVSAKGDGTDEAVWTYLAEKVYQEPYTVTITNPDGTKTEQFLHSEAPGTPRPYGFGDSKTGRSYEDRSYSSTGQLLRRTLTKYTATGPLTGGYSGATRDLRVEKEISIIFEPGETNALATMTETVYDTADVVGSTDPAYFSSLNPKQIKKYHYITKTFAAASADTLTPDTAAGWFTGATPASLTETEYLYDADYKSRNITGLAARTELLDPASPRLS